MKRLVVLAILMAGSVGQPETGTACDDTVQRPLNCHKVAGIGIASLEDIVNTGATPEVPVFDLMEPKPMNVGCEKQALTSAAEWVLVDSTGGGTPTYFVSKTID